MPSVVNSVNAARMSAHWEKKPQPMRLRIGWRTLVFVVIISYLLAHWLSCHSLGETVSVARMAG
jgi:hypothetical protein